MSRYINFHSIDELSQKVRFDSKVEDDLKGLDGNRFLFLLATIDALLTTKLETTPLANRPNSKLSGYFKKKNAKLGFRIVYRYLDDLSEEIVEILEIVVIGRRDDSEVYRLANQRITRKHRTFDLPNSLKKAKRLIDKKDTP